MVDICQEQNALASTKRYENISPASLRLHAFAGHIPEGGALDLYAVGKPKLVPESLKLWRYLILVLVVLDRDDEGIWRAGRTTSQVFPQRLPNQPIETKWSTVDLAPLLRVNRHDEICANLHKFCDKSL